MTDALRYEWVRLKTLRSTYWITGLSLLVCILFALTALGKNGALTVDDYGDLMTGGGVALSSIFLGLIGVFSIGHEYRYNTIRPTLSAIPRRSVLMAAKTIVVLVYVGAVILVCQIVTYLECWIILGSRLTTLGLFPSPMGRVWIGTIGYVTVVALVGLALSGLLRSMPAAIVTLILFPLLVENLIKGLLTIDALKSIRPIAKFLPFTAGQQIFSYQPIDSKTPSGFREVPAPWTGAIIFIVFMSILLALSWTLFEKRDA